MNDGKDKTGLLASTADGTFFIPQDELSRYKLPTDVAAGVGDAVDSEVEGFGLKDRRGGPVVKDAMFAFTGSFSAAKLPCQYSDCPI